jgi:hypothetical protein
MSHFPYAIVIGSLMYAMVYTRPDICTTSYGLCYQGRPILDRVLDIYGFVDAY